MDSQPNQIVSGPDGNLWFTESTLNGGVIGRITPSGAISTFTLPEGHEPDAVATGCDGALWFTDVVFGSKRITGRVGRITRAGAIRYFALPTPEAQPAGLALGANGDLWFTAGTPHLVRSKSKGRRSVPVFVGSVGRITPSGRITEYPIRHLSLEIVPGPRGHEMLFVPESSDEIGRINLSGKVSEYPIRGRHSALARATAAVADRIARVH
jgi:virginiamycin B lyase